MKRMVLIFYVLFFSLIFAKNDPLEIKMIDNYVEEISKKIKEGGLENKNIAVLEFEKDENIIDEKLISKLKFKLYNSNMIERKDLQKVISEQKLQLSGLTDTEKGMEIGKLTGADTLVLGKVYLNENKINKYRGFFKEEDIQNIRIGINTKIIDVETGEIKFSDVYNLEENQIVYKKKFSRASTYIPSFLIGIGAWYAYSDSIIPVRKDAKDSYGNSATQINPTAEALDQWEANKDEFNEKSLIAGGVNIVLSWLLSELSYKLLP